jgi:septal ring-binding cell division protein DamX
MQLSKTLAAALLLTTVVAAAAQLPAQVRDGLAAAVARGDQTALLTQAELVVSKEIDGDEAAARATLTRAAQHGDVRAAYILGVLAYRNADIAGAQAWWQQAASGGMVDAHYNLGLLLARDPAQSDAADAQLETAAREQHVLACFALGTRLADHDEPAARRWLECAAQQGYAPAQFNLARLYARASEHAEDQDAARRWYAAAAPTFAPAAAALAALPRLPAPDAKPDIPATPLTLHDQAWVMAQPATAYTVQIASGASADVLENLLRRELHEGDAACVAEHPGSRQAYSAIIGVYPDRVSAERASGKLPVALRTNTPWVRRYSSLQQALRDADKQARPGAAAHAVSN